MADGLEVTIQYRGAKYIQVAAPATPSSEFAILKKDLAHLRVHSPSQRNVRRVNGSFVLHWPSAGTSLKVAGLADSLHTRWFKLCSDDPEALKLREFLSIESITLKQDGLLIRSTVGAEQPSQDAPSGTLAGRLAGPLQEIATASVPAPSRAPPPPPIPPPRLPPSAPRLDRQPPPQSLKRRMSSGEGPSNQTRQKLDVPETPTAAAAAPLPPTDTQPQPTQPITSPVVDPQPTPGDATRASPQPTQDDTTPTAPKDPDTSTTPPLRPREPGEMTPRPVGTTLSGPSNTGPDLGSGPGLGPGPGPGSGSGLRPPPPHPPYYPTLSSTGPSPGSPYAGSNSSGNSHGGGGDSWARRRDRDRDVNRLTRELWDTRRQLTAMQAREQAILDDLERLGVRPESSSGADRHGVGVSGSREALLRSEADVRAERARRLRAERALSDVERECAAPFVVPALFQAFMSISELSN